MSITTKDFKTKIGTLIGKKPDVIGIELTTYCPLNCTYCSRVLNENKDRELSWEDFLLMKEKVQNFNTITLCGMGEPMFYSKIYDVVHALRDKQIVIITSGTILIDFVKLNKYRNVKMISFSVDAANEEEMKSIATRYNWENLINNLKPTRPIIKIINCTVGEHNYKILPEIARFAVKHKLVAISFTMAYLNEDKERDVHKLVQPYLEEAKSIVKAGGVAYTDSFSAAKCIYIDSIIPFININGDVFPCCRGVNCGQSAGNIYNETFDKLWEGDMYQGFTKGSLCENDCWLYKDRVIGEGNG